MEKLRLLTLLLWRRASILGKFGSTLAAEALSLSGGSLVGGATVTVQREWRRKESTSAEWSAELTLRNRSGVFERKAYTP
jgi:hypothetical protein